MSVGSAGHSALAWGAGAGGIVAPPCVSGGTLAGACVSLSFIFLISPTGGNCPLRGLGLAGDWGRPRRGRVCGDPDGSHLKRPQAGEGDGPRAMRCVPAGARGLGLGLGEG